MGPRFKIPHRGWSLSAPLVQSWPKSRAAVYRTMRTLHRRETARRPKPDMTPETLEVQFLCFLQAMREIEGVSKEQEVAGLFNGCLNFLQGKFPNPSVNRLAAVLRDIVEHKIVPVTWGRNVRALSFVIDREQDMPHAMIVPPLEWTRDLGRDPLTELGAVVFVGCNAVDYANERFREDPENTRTRALAYEAEYLKTVRSLSPGWEPGQYHLRILEEYPEGLATPKARKVLYNAKPLIFA